MILHLFYDNSLSNKETGCRTPFLVLLRLLRLRIRQVSDVDELRLQVLCPRDVVTLLPPNVWGL